MAFVPITAHDALMDRADRAIANAASTRADVRAGLIAAGQRVGFRPCPSEPKPSRPLLLQPLPRDNLLDPWWLLALASHQEIVRAADEELERSYRLAVPRLESPSSLFEGAIRHD